MEEVRRLSKKLDEGAISQKHGKQPKSSTSSKRGRARDHNRPAAGSGDPFELDSDPFDAEEDPLARELRRREQQRIKEELAKAERKIKQEGDEVLGSVVTRSRSITIVAWDHGTEDGDRVRILHNDQTVRGVWRLAKKRSDLTVQLSPGINRIRVYALNEGSKSPNTAAFHVVDSGSKVARKQWNLDRGQGATLIVLRHE